MDTKTVKKIADKEVMAHEKRMHPGAKKMAAGGKTNDMMKQYGRGMAKVMDQKSGSK